MGTPREELLKIVDSDDLLPLGTYSARRSGGGLEVTYPVLAARHNELEKSDDLDLFLHPKSGTLLVKPVSP